MKSFDFNKVAFPIASCQHTISIIKDAHVEITMRNRDVFGIDSIVSNSDIKIVWLHSNCWAFSLSHSSTECEFEQVRFSLLFAKKTSNGCHHDNINVSDIQCDFYCFDERCAITHKNERRLFGVYCSMEFHKLFIMVLIRQ